MKQLTKFLIWLGLGLFVCFYGMCHTLAFETKTIYSDSSRTNSNKYLYGSNAQGGIVTASINSNINGVSYGFSFWLNENVMLNKTYTLKINFMGDDLYNSFSSNMVNVATCYSSTCNDNIILSIEKQSNSGRSTWLKITFNPVSTGSYLYVGLSSDSTPLEAIAGPVAFGISSVQIESVNESQNIIDNQTTNANNIINNQNQNTQYIIDNQNSIAEQQQENQQVCEIIDNNYLEKDNKYLMSSGEENTSPSGNYAISSYIPLSSNDKLKVLTNYNSGDYMCFYNINKSKLSCINQLNFQENSYISIPANTSYFRFTIQKTSSKPRFQLCKNGNQALNDTIGSDNIDTNNANSFFNNFTDNNHGLSGIISSPLNAINAMLSNQCSPLTATWKNKTMSLPCGTEMWSKFSTFKDFLNIVLDGLICYRILLKLFKLVQKFKNPNDDRVEVMDL